MAAPMASLSRLRSATSCVCMEASKSSFCLMPNDDRCEADGVDAPDMGAREAGAEDMAETLSMITDQK